MASRLTSGEGENQPGHFAPLDLAELVAARICHDLVSPVGAVCNGIDLMQELGSAEPDDLRMAADSAGRAAAMLKLHRLAFGAVDDASAEISRRELAARCAPIAATRRVTFSVEGQDGPALSPHVARMASLMAMAARALLGLEGTVQLALGQNGLPVTAEAVGPRAQWTPALESLTFGSGTEATSRHVEFLLLQPAACAAGARLEPINENGRAGIQASPA